MKKAVVCLMVLATVGLANGALATNNGGFDASAAGWNAAGGGGAWTPAHVALGGNPGGYLTLQTANNTWSVWYQVINESLAVWGIPAGTTITVKGDMIDLGPVGNNKIAGLKVESWSGGLLNESAKEFTATSSWQTFSFDYTIAAGATAVKLVLTNVNYNGLGVAKFGYDNLSISFPGATPALFPIPTVGNSAVAPASDIISWTNPAPYNPSETILCDVWFRTSTTPLADPNLVPGQPGALQIANDEAINSLDLSTKGITLVADRYYYWKVNVIDPNNGAPKQTNGFNWWFYTGDAAPVVNAGTDQYVWLTAGTKTFTLNGTFTDDGKSSITTTWTLNPLTETDPATIVTIANPTVVQGIKTSGTHTTNVTVNNTGWFFFDFTATDTAGAAVDTVNVGVYVDACAAAYADPADLKFEADVNGDCKVDLDDLAIMASEWIRCMSTKLGCTP
ncbi:MAG: hypothetical protein FJ263_10340 [Planctomycetes bacterium]|nr:hypothetical protein [Planctomycetota bacterium]